MNTRSHLLIASLALLIASCKKDDDTPPSPGGGGNNTGGGNGPGHVYVCGGENTGGSTDWYPRYWKDGVEHVVGDGSRGNAHAIWANDAHVIIAGMVYDGGLMMPCYWQDGDLQELNTYACGDCRAEDVFVVGENDVHLAGHVRIDDQFSTTQKAMYWNNGVGMELTDGQHDARAYGVFVENGDVYVCGYEKDGPGGRKLAKYWVNGVPVVLGDGEESSEAYAIWVENGTVYVAGYEEADPLNMENFEERPALWVNGVRDLLSSFPGHAEGLFVKNGEVHVVGYTQPVSGSNMNMATRWVNGVSSGIYTSAPPQNGSRGRDIFVHNGEVHTVMSYFGVTGSAGHYANNTTPTQAFLGDVAWGIHIY
ncbi:MAG: hypothetical protein MUE88_05285 [Flavobacteriales bacterium]|jgi:hypothetical protein|nr:hypothetical protein [Flavobacteriales bacterium]